MNEGAEDTTASSDLTTFADESTDHAVGTDCCPRADGRTVSKQCVFTDRGTTFHVAVGIQDGSCAKGHSLPDHAVMTDVASLTELVRAIDPVPEALLQKTSWNVDPRGLGNPNRGCRRHVVLLDRNDYPRFRHWNMDVRVGLQARFGLQT